MQRHPSYMGGPFGWGASRQTTLLAASILSSCFLLAEGQTTTTINILVQLQPPHPVEGEDVTLIPILGGIMKKVENCHWYRGLTVDENRRIISYVFRPRPMQASGLAFTGRETIGPRCTLHIRNLTSEVTGNYIVILQGPGINAKLSTPLFVSEKLSSPVLWPSDVLVAENSNVTLNCTTSNNIDVSVSWFKDGKPLLDIAGHLNRNRILTLIRITKNDAGLYTCEDSKLGSSVMSNSANITVAYGPEIKLNPEGTVEKSLNCDLKLECTAVSVPAAQFLWYFDNIMLDATGSIFQVRLSNWNDEGKYTCQATNPFTNHRAVTTIYVTLTKEKLSSPVLWPSDVLVAENSNVTLNCTTSNNIDVRVSWFKDSKPLLAVSGLSDRNRTLTLIHVTKNDAGLYTCEASDPGSSVKSNSTKITVAYPAALGVGAIAGIVIGSLAVTALLVGSLLYVFLRAPQTRAAPSYENVFLSTQVKTDSPTNSIHIYETLQHEDQLMYQQLKILHPSPDTDLCGRASAEDLPGSNWESTPGSSC